METMTAIEAMRTIEKQAESASQDVRDIKDMAIGAVVRQGDIYIHRVPSSHPHGPEVKSRQLAEGSTMNSRHMAESPAKVYEGTTAPKDCNTVLLGPCVESDKPFTVSHPEHAHINLPAGIYQITHQMDARTLQRVRD